VVFNVFAVLANLKRVPTAVYYAANQTPVKNTKTIMRC